MIAEPSHPPQSAVHRRHALTAWETNLSTLQRSCNGFMESTTALLKTCPLNISGDSGEDDPEHGISVAGTFAHIANRIGEIALMEEQLKMARVALALKRNRMVRISHLSRLPVELLTQIFEYAVEDSDVLHGDEVFEAIRPWDIQTAKKYELPLVFTWVCQHWRDVALNTPSLWSRINFREGSPFYKTQRKLVRSQDSPLTLTLNTYRKPPDPYLNIPTYISTALAAALPAFPRWRNLRLISSSAEDIRHAFAALQPKSPLDKWILPKLESLEIHCHTVAQENIAISTSNQSIEFFNTMTARLARLSIRAVRLPSWSHSAFHNLKYLSIAGVQNMAAAQQPRIAELKSILTACPQLETLILDTFGLQDTMDYFTVGNTQNHAAFWIEESNLPGSTGSSILDVLPAPTMVHLHHLQSLQLRNLNARTLGMILLFLDTPNLCSFLLETAKDSAMLPPFTRFVYEATSRFLSSGPAVPGRGTLLPLERFYLDDRAHHFTPTTQLLSRSVNPNLHELTLLRELNVNESFIQSTLVRFQRLESLRIIKAESIQCEALVQLIIERMNAAGDLSPPREGASERVATPLLPAMISDGRSLPFRIRRLHVLDSQMDPSGVLLIESLRSVISEVKAEGNYLPSAGPQLEVEVIDLAES